MVIWIGLWKCTSLCVSQCWLETLHHRGGQDDHPMDVSRSLSLATPRLMWWSCKQWQQWQGYMLSKCPITWIPTLQSRSSYWHCWVPNLPDAELSLSLLYGTTPQKDQPITCWQVSFLRPCPGPAASRPSAFASATILRPAECLHYQYSFHATLSQRKSDNGWMTRESIGLSLYYSGTAGA